MSSGRAIFRAEETSTMVHCTTKGLLFRRLVLRKPELDEDLFFLTWLEWEELVAWVEREGKPSLTSTEPPRLLERRRRQKGG